MLDNQIEQSVNKNWNTLLNNFVKISSWFAQGTASKHAMPKPLTDAVNTLNDTVNSVAQQQQVITQQQQMIAKQQQMISQQQQAIEQLMALTQQLNARLEQAEKTLADYETPQLGDTSSLQAFATAPVEPQTPQASEPAVETKPTSEPAVEAKMTTKEVVTGEDVINSLHNMAVEEAVNAPPTGSPDPLEVSRQAIDAGMLDPNAFSQLDSLISGMLK